MRTARITLRLLCGAAFVSCAFLLVSCGPSRPNTASVKGTITYKGKPVPHGTIMFVPTEGTAATADIKNGEYNLKTFRPGDGAILGNHTVAIISLTNQGDLLPEERRPLAPPLLPLEYSFPDKSGLTAVVENKVNIINFDLKELPAP